MNNQIQLVLKSSTTELSLNDHELGIYLTPELDGLTGLPEIRTTSGVNAGYDGGWTSAQNYDARSIVIRGVIASEDVATVERLRRQLVALAGQGKNEELSLDLVTEAGNAYTVQVHTMALDMAMQKVLHEQPFMLTLRADDPLIYDASETTHEALLQVAKATGGFRINFELPLAITGGSEETVVNNDGLEQVPTITRMYGALHNPKLINQTTNQSMQIMADLGYAEGDWISPSEVVEGENLTIDNAPEGAPLSSFSISGNTVQNGTPTPDAPVAVQTVTGENVVKICGKNLFNADTETLVFIDSNGNIIAGSTWSCSDYIKVSPNTTYAWHGEQTGSLGGQVIWAGYDSSQAFISGQYAQVNNTAGTSFTAGASTEYVRVGYRNDRLEKMQFELGSATAYEPYRGQSYEANLGKNLFDGSIYKENYVIASNGAENPATGGVITTAVRVEPNTTYTASVNWDASSPDKYMRVGIYTSDMTFISRPSSTAAGAPTTFTTPANARYVRLSYFVPATEVQLELGSTATSYATYFEPIELCKIGDYQDYIYKSGDKWYVHKAIGEYTFTGASVEPWVLGNNNTNTIDFRINNTNFLKAVATGSNYITAFVDRFIGKENGASADVECFWFNQSGCIRIRIAKSRLAGLTAADFAAWLASNNTKVYYALATPTDTEITNEALVAQLEAVLENARMYNPQTNIAITFAEGNAQGSLAISYFTDKNPDVRDEIVIDSRLRTVTLNGLDIYHLIAEGSEFLMLAPGENKLSLQSDITGDNGYAQVSYKQGYLSI